LYFSNNFYGKYIYFLNSLDFWCNIRCTFSNWSSCKGGMW